MWLRMTYALGLGRKPMYWEGFAPSVSELQAPRDTSFLHSAQWFCACAHTDAPGNAPGSTEWQSVILLMYYASKGISRELHPIIHCHRVECNCYITNAPYSRSDSNWGLRLQGAESLTARTWEFTPLLWIAHRSTPSQSVRMVFYPTRAHAVGRNRTRSICLEGRNATIYTSTALLIAFVLNG